MNQRPEGSIDHPDVLLRMSDGVSVAVRIRRPGHDRRVATLFAASPYRYDNDDLPETGAFLWRETGPIGWYVEHDFAYVHLDVRGTGKSGGEYGFFDRRERRDLYETIQWIAQQPWSNGNVGGIGHSYYAAPRSGAWPPNVRRISNASRRTTATSIFAAAGPIPAAFRAFS